MPAKRPPSPDDDQSRTPRRPSPYRPVPLSPNTKATPRVARQSQRPNARGQRVKKLSEVLMHDLGGIVENTVSYFKKNVLPDIPDVDLLYQSKVLADRLKRKGVHIINGRWLGFEVNPSQMKEHEDKVFVKVKDVWDVIIEESKSLPAFRALVSEILVKMTAKPRHHGQGTRSSRSRPDLLLELNKSRVVSGAVDKLSLFRYLFGNIVAFFEAKKRSRKPTRYQNIKQMVINANFLLCEDPTRRGVISYSIEDTDMRIWIFTRSGAMVSEAFNFITDHETLIYVFLSMAYATQEKVGFNTNMTMIRSPFEEIKNSIQYEIQFEDRVLRTTSVPLSDYKADFFMGRATRVYKVQDTVNAQPAFALRMSWLPLGSKMEDERLKEIHQAIKALGLNKPANLDMERYWLTVVLSGYNTFPRGENSFVEDSTNLFAREDFNATEFYPGYTELQKILPLKTLKGSGRGRATGHVPEEDTPASYSGLIHSPYTGDARSYHLSHNTPRIHYLIGYKEICQPLHDQRLLHEVFYALADAVFGLWSLHKAGFVHRDVSTGNILVYSVGEGENKKIFVKIADLEYMRKMTDLSISNEIKTGTLQFTSVELQRRCHQFWRDKKSIAQTKGPGYVQSVEKHQQEDFDTLGVNSESSSKSEIGPPRYNALHDLESLYWIALWFLCYHCPASEQKNWFGEKGNQQLDMAYTVFTEHYSMIDPPSNRQSCLIGDAGLDMVFKTIPDAFSHAKATVKRVRQHLETYYTEVENRPEFPEPYTTALEDEAYIALELLFRRLADVMVDLGQTEPIVRTKYTATAAPRSLTPTKKVAAAGPGPSSSGNSNDVTGPQASLTARLKGTSISDDKATPEPDFESEDEEDGNPDVDFDAWDLVTSDDLRSESGSGSDFALLSDPDDSDNDHGSTNFDDTDPFI